MLDLTETAGAEAAGGDDLSAASLSRVAGIAIVGSNPATVMAAPFDDPSWTIWACSPDNTPFGHSKNRRELPRVDLWFEVHEPIEDPSRPFAYLNYVAQLPAVMLRDRRALASGVFKGAIPYPEAEFKGTSTWQKLEFVHPSGQVELRRVEVPNGDGLFCPYMFTSSIAYMLAKAIVDCERNGIRQIGLWGILQMSENEYSYQRPGIQYFLHEAMKRGIKVKANRESCLFDMPQWKW